MGFQFLTVEELHRDHSLVARSTQLLDAVSAADGVAAFGEAFLRGIAEPHGHRHALAFDDEQLVGILAVDGASAEQADEPTAEMAVAPNYRRQGVARGLITAADQQWQLAGPVDVWAHGDLPAARAMAEALGARETRQLHKMAADADVRTQAGATQRASFDQASGQAKAAVAARGLSVLSYKESAERFGAQLADQEWVRVNNEAFAWHPEQGGWDEARLQDARHTDWFDPEGVIMLWALPEASGEAQEDPRCLGFHWTKIPTEETAKPQGQRAGEVYVVCLADEARGQGLGSAITMLGVGHLLHQGVGTVELYVEGDNEPAVATYRKLGFRIVHTDVVYRGEILDRDGGKQ